MRRTPRTATEINMRLSLLPGTTDPFFNALIYGSSWSAYSKSFDRQVCCDLMTELETLLF